MSTITNGPKPDATMPARRTADSKPPEATARLVPSGLLGGIGGLLFVVLVVVQNAIRSGFPMADDGAAEVTEYYAAHRGMSVLLGALFPAGALGLVLFLAALVSRVAAGRTRAAGIAGAIGGVGIAAGFTMVTATDIALAEYIHRGDPAASVVDALWVLHTAVFAVLLIWIGVTVAALTAASAAAGILHTAWRAAGLLAGIALLVAGGSAFGVLGGSGVLFVGLAGFAVWAVFVVVASIHLLRDRRH